jgi:hypothetical protein
MSTQSDPQARGDQRAQHPQVRAERRRFSDSVRRTIIATVEEAQALETISSTTRTLVERASEIGVDVGDAARGAIEGAIQGARRVGLDVGQSAAAAASGALDAAKEIGSSAREAVEKVAEGTVDGVKLQA